MRFQEQAVLGAVRLRLGLDDMFESSYRNVDTLQSEHTAFSPNVVELESRHFQSEIDFESSIIRGPGESPSLDDARSAKKSSRGLSIGSLPDHS